MAHHPEIRRHASICYNNFTADNLFIYLARKNSSMYVMSLFLGHGGLQCLTSCTWIKYRWDATGDMPELVEVWPEETPWTVPQIRRWHHRAPLSMSRIMPEVNVIGL